MRYDAVLIAKYVLTFRKSLLFTYSMSQPSTSTTSYIFYMRAVKSSESSAFIDIPKYFNEYCDNSNPTCVILSRTSIVSARRRVNFVRLYGQRNLLVQAWTGPECFRRLRLPEFIENLHTKIELSCRLRPPLLPVYTSGTNVC